IRGSVSLHRVGWVSLSVRKFRTVSSSPISPECLFWIRKSLQGSFPLVALDPLHDRLADVGGNADVDPIGCPLQPLVVVVGQLDPGVPRHGLGRGLHLLRLRLLLGHARLRRLGENRDDTKRRRVVSLSYT